MPTKRERASAPARRAKSSLRPNDKLAALLAHAEEHGIKPVADPDAMRAGFWPAEESVDNFVAAIRALRRQGQ